jgi:hypothetical protein
MMVNHLRERFYSADREFVLDCEELVPELTNSDSPTGDPMIPQSDPVLSALEEFRLETGLPVWVFRMGDALLEKRVCIVHAQNSTYLTYRLLKGSGRLEVQPALHVRPHEGALEGPAHEQYRFGSVAGGFELWVSDDLPLLRLAWPENRPRSAWILRSSPTCAIELSRVGATIGRETSGRRECSRLK